MERNPRHELAEALAGAARIAEEAGVTLKEFMASAWEAFVEQHPGLRERIEHEHDVAQLRALRQRGLVAEA